MGEMKNNRSVVLVQIKNNPVAAGSILYYMYSQYLLPVRYLVVSRAFKALSAELPLLPSFQPLQLPFFMI